MMKEKDFSELTRVQIPAALHLMRMGYTDFLGMGRKLQKEIQIQHPVSVFKKQFLKFNNYLTEDDFGRTGQYQVEPDQMTWGVHS